MNASEALNKTTIYNPQSIHLQSLIGLLLLVLGQCCMLWHEPLVASFTLGEQINQYYRIELRSANNVLIGSMLLWLGALLIWPRLGRIPRPNRIVPTTAPTSVDRPPLISRMLPFMLLMLASILWATLILLLAARQYAAWMPGYWLLAIGLLLASTYWYERQRSPEPILAIQIRVSGHLPSHQILLDFAFILVLLLIGLTIGSYQLGQIPSFPWPDEAPFFERARAIALGQQRPGIFESGVFTFPILSSIYQAQIMRWFGVDLWGWRFSSVVVSTLAIIPTYLLARDLFDRRIATVTCVCMLSLPYFLSFSRMGYNNSQSILPSVTALYALNYGLQRQRMFASLLGGIAAGIGFYSYSAAMLAFVVGLGMVSIRSLSCVWDQDCATVGRRATAWGRVAVPLACGLAFVGGWVALILPQVIAVHALYPERAQLKFIETLLAEVGYAHQYLPDADLVRDMPLIQAGSIQLFVRPDLYAYLLVRGLVRSFLIFHYDQLIDAHFLVGPLAGTLGTVPYLIGLLVATRNALRHLGARLLLFWFAGGVVALSAIHSWAPRYTHMVPLIPALSMLIALGIVSLIDLVPLFGRTYRATTARQGDRQTRGRTSLSPRSPFQPLQSPIRLARLHWVAVCAITGTIACHGIWQYMVEMPRIYQPTLLDHAMRRSMELRPGQNLLYIAQNDAERDLSSWLNSGMPAGSELLRPALADFDHGGPDLRSGQEYLLFYHPEEAALVTGYLEHHAARRQESAFYRDSRGAIVGMALAVQAR